MKNKRDLRLLNGDAGLFFYNKVRRIKPNQPIEQTIRKWINKDYVINYYVGDDFKPDAVHFIVLGVMKFDNGTLLLHCTSSNTTRIDEIRIHLETEYMYSLIEY